MKILLKKVKYVISQLIEGLALYLIFIFGVGFTNIVARLFLKSFLQKKHSFTSWKNYSSSKKLRKMY